MKKLVLFLAGEIESPEGIRGYYLFRHRKDVAVVSRDWRLAYYLSVLFHLFILCEKNVYFMGFDVLTVLFAWIRSLFIPINIIYDTGDIQCELSRAFRPWYLTNVVCHLERWILSNSKIVVVRTLELRRILSKGERRVVVIRDGVDYSLYSKFTGVPDDIIVGTTGTFNRDRRTGRISGREVIDVLVELRKKGIKARGIVAGRNSVLRELSGLAKEAGVEVQFIPEWTEYRKFPRVLEGITFAINLQTNDSIGSVRLGGKIPPYLASGRYVISSNVPECRTVLPECFLVEYNGSDDRDFPGRVAEKIVDVLKSPHKFNNRLIGLKIAKEYFDYSVLRDSIDRILDSIGL